MEGQAFGRGRISHQIMGSAGRQSSLRTRAISAEAGLLGMPPSVCRCESVADDDVRRTRASNGQCVLDVGDLEGSRRCGRRRRTWKLGRRALVGHHSAFTPGALDQSSGFVIGVPTTSRP
jgi:hypothetical protein